MPSSHNLSAFRSAAAALILSLALSSTALSAQAPAPLPAVAQEALDKGVLAAKVPDYLLAIRFFEEARQSAPSSPIVFLNLGLAESKIPGRELRAIAWFAAYLAVYPDAPNAAAVKNQIALLHVTSQSNISRLIKAVQDAGTKPSSDRDEALGDVPLFYAKVGDIPAALKVVDLLESDVFKSTSLENIVETLADSGDIDGALKVARTIQRSEIGFDCNALVYIAGRQLENGDRIGARKTFDEALIHSTRAASEQMYTDWDLAQIGSTQAHGDEIAWAQATADRVVDSGQKVLVLASIATAQLRNGNRAEAQKSLAAALQAVGTDNPPGLATIAEVQTTMGDKAGARKGIDRAVVVAERADPMYGRGNWPGIAEAQAANGDIRGALKSYDHLTSTFPTAAAATLILIVKQQIKAGDIEGARKTASLAKDQSTRATTQQLIATALANRLPKTAQSLRPPASDWISKLDNIDQDDDCPLNTAPFLDLVTYLNSLPPSEVAAATKQTARSIALAQNVVDRMLKRQGLR